MIRFTWSSTELPLLELEWINLVAFFLLLFIKGCNNKNMQKLFDFIRWLLGKTAQISNEMVDRLIETLQYLVS